MSLRALLNVVCTWLYAGCDEEERDELDAQMADPDGWAKAKQQQQIDDLRLAGGEVA